MRCVIREEGLQLCVAVASKIEKKNVGRVSNARKGVPITGVQTTDLPEAKILLDHDHDWEQPSTLSSS